MTFGYYAGRLAQYPLAYFLMEAFMGMLKEPAAAPHYLASMDAQGDTRIQWHPDNPVEVEVARGAFERLTRAGYRAFFVNTEGEQGQPMTTFDPSAQAIIMVPRIVGG